MHIIDATNWTQEYRPIQFGIGIISAWSKGVCKAALQVFIPVSVAVALPEPPLASCIQAADSENRVDKDACTDSISHSYEKTKAYYGRYPKSITDPDSFNPGYFLIVGQRDSIPEFNKIKDVPEFVGIKKIYSWRALEPRIGEYDFSDIESDLEYLQSIGKRLWLQIKETQYFATYEPHIPEYMWRNPKYGCGSPSPDGRKFYGVFWRNVHNGHWVVCRGNEEFDERHQALYKALGDRFDKEPYIEGITLDETSTGANPHEVEEIYNSFKELALATKNAFPSKVVSQMINYAPFDLNNFGEFLRSNGIATTGPDVIPKRAGSSLKTAYMIHKKNHWETPNSIDIQWSNWDRYGKTYSSQELLDFAIETVNPWYLFWAQNPDYLDSQTIPAVRSTPLPAASEFYKH